MNDDLTKNIPELIRNLYKIVNKLESLFPGRKFTPDGHLIGSIGEVIAQYRYNLKLLPASEKTHDATNSNGESVQIKITQVDRVALRSEPDQLIVLKLDKNGEVTEIYNGIGRPVWDHCGSLAKNGQRSISLKKLASLQKENIGI